jgi:hypothetical protein
MEHFAVGYLSLAFAAFLAGGYLLFRQARRFGAWVQREEGPKERVVPMLVILAAIGFVAGSLAQPLWDKGAQCAATGRPVMQCFLAR